VIAYGLTFLSLALPSFVRRRGIKRG